MEEKTIVIENGLSNYEKRELLKATKEVIHLLTYEEWVEVLEIYDRAIERVLGGK